VSWKRVAIPLAGLPVVALLAYGLTRDATLVPSPLPGRPAPDFAMSALSGDSVRLADLRGQVVLLNFWASWCLPCLQEHPLLVAADERWREQGLRIVGVVYQDSPGNARDWLRERGGEWVHGLDPGSRLAIEYGLFGVPETFFIDRAGVIRYKHVGPLTADVVSTWVTRLLADSSAAAPDTTPSSAQPRSRGAS
jgi:cytochrome c biogenesis protein CcmG/thiol:disulfide interchange protein DsbE